jgi:hypothetical protein
VNSTSLNSQGEESDDNDKNNNIKIDFRLDHVVNNNRLKKILTTIIMLKSRAITNQ